MTPSSAKAKGRRAASELRDLILKRFPALTADDLRVTPSGVTGEDLQRSQLAREYLPYAFEVKCVERLNIWDAIKQSRTHCKDMDVPVVAFKRNREQLHICLPIEAFLDLITE